MKNHTHLVISALFVAIFALLAPASFAQKGQAMSKAQDMAQQLSLTPQQKEKILPILACRSTKTTTHQKRQFDFKNAMKMQEVRALHQQTDPQMKAILSPEQYEKLKHDSCTGKSAKPRRADGPTDWMAIDSVAVS